MKYCYLSAQGSSSKDAMESIHLWFVKKGAHALYRSIIFGAVSCKGNKMHPFKLFGFAFALAGAAFVFTMLITRILA